MKKSRFDLYFKLILFLILLALPSYALFLDISNGLSFMIVFDLVFITLVLLFFTFLKEVLDVDKDVLHVSVFGLEKTIQKNNVIWSIAVQRSDFFGHQFYEIVLLSKGKLSPFNIDVITTPLCNGVYDSEFYEAWRT